MPNQRRLYKGVPLGRNRQNGVLLKRHEIEVDDQVECVECGSIKLEDLAFSRQIGYFEDICVAIVRCDDCGEVSCYLWSEEKRGI